MHLEHLPTDFARRIRPATDPRSWGVSCGSAKNAEWVAWNVRQDAWYTKETLDEVCAAIGVVDETIPGLEGPELLAECAELLRHIRGMDAAERSCLPASGVNHVTAPRFRGKFELAPESAYAEGSAPGELDPTLLVGERIRVLPRGPSYFRWLTFDPGGHSPGKAPDDVARLLGLPWAPAYGTVVRIEVPIDAILRAGASVVIPTFFDAFYPGPPVSTDWRARPMSEHRAGEPWGYARDMRHDGPGLPEIIADIRPATKMDAEILGR